ncbi:fumarylacetoacetate hydrolase family protein [Trinickia acidisoli]|uniref:fumarylacetoacetate hydrolase family protein n=1 Tax=Trinickia acidisoli TaxID=2767482 RepID=UPI001A8D8B56|nr:fumarylacetoacetate hydrolase family protein [Trinickia acidisoli]
MALHVLHYRFEGRARWGVIRDRRITPIPGEFATTAAFIRACRIEELAALESERTIPESDVEWLSPVTSNQQFVCQGANYRQHMIESGMDPDAKKFNMIFTKAPSCIVPANAFLVRPTHVRFLDYEIELGLILKRDITSRRTIAEVNLHEYVAGAVIVNDYSARDIQIPQMQFYKGKSYRTFGPVGPYLCLLEARDIAQLRDLQLTLTVNGEVRQSDSTANLVYGPAETLTELSGVQDLYAGDLLATGTPSGCALSIPSPAKQRIAGLLPERAKWRIFDKVQAGCDRYLKAGDVVESRIASRDRTIDLGVQRNCVIDEVA